MVVFFSLLGKGGFEYGEALLFVALLVTIFFMDQKLKKKSIPIVDFLIEKLERPNVMPIHGAFWYGVGLLLILSFLNNTNYIYASIAILAFGDGAATLVGRSGKIRLFHNKNKTLEGSIAFFIASSIASYPFIGIAALPLSLLCAFFESIDTRLDDNLVVPIICVVFFLLIGFDVLPNFLMLRL
jgi:dolichol kinase